MFQCKKVKVLQQCSWECHGLQIWMLYNKTLVGFKDLVYIIIISRLQFSAEVQFHWTISQIVFREWVKFSKLIKISVRNCHILINKSFNFQPSNRSNLSQLISQFLESKSQISISKSVKFQPVNRSNFSQLISQF